ncbi:hypothetical protein [Streptomyces sp. NPDC050504]|uniref:hypothetical protein n=1 Tax=Streptomyces sp. NPDC050504 TaxID=3365618 RepID=UPI003799EBDB
MTAPVPPQPPAPGTGGAGGQGDQPPPAGPLRPLPSGTDMTEWEQVVPGASERVLRIVEEDSAALREIQRSESRHRMRMDIINFRFQLAGACFAATSFAGVLWIAKYFIDHGAVAPATGVLGAAVAAVSAVAFGTRKGK